ncbi:MAG TPA: 23S rRNA (guanosine(2251)-2'-O)-methyltransferase RlmB [candidate division Zixibacteria bacterium]|nr:23S rRNA (guanosine(2251)-2'-O)-methyltransferase RlmB [candidate division Zixibacteria bacterium]
MTEREMIYGRNPLLEVVCGKREVFEIWLTKETNKAIGKEIRQAGYKPRIVSKGEIGQITGRRDNQGAAAEVAPFEYAKIEALRKIPEGVIIACDGITDQRNLGAVIRSAVLLGARGIIIPERGSAEVNAVVTHTSAGATEHIAIAKTENLPHELGILKQMEFAVVGAVMPDEETLDIRDYETPSKLCLVIGDEGEGISGKVLSKCDVRLSIPQTPRFDSFNVSVAASIILYELRRKQL